MPEVNIFPSLCGWLVGCTTSDSDTFQPFVAPRSQDTRDKTAWKWHFSVGQPVCDIHRFETHSWQPFFPLRWQLTVSNVVPLFVKGSAWQPVEVIGAKPIILGHDRTQPQAWLPCLGAKQNSLFNPKHQITDLKLRGKGWILWGGEKWFLSWDQCSKLQTGGWIPPPKITQPRWEAGFRRSYIFAGVGIY